MRKVDLRIKCRFSSVVRLKIADGEIVLHRDCFPVALPARRRNVYNAIRVERRITSHVIKVKQKDEISTIPEAARLHTKFLAISRSRGYKGTRTFNDDILTKARPTRATTPLLSNLVREVRISWCKNSQSLYNASCSLDRVYSSV